MLKSRSWWIGCAVGAVLWLIVFSAMGHAATPKPHKLAPPIPCTSKLRMDIHIDEDNIMYECQCQWLKTIPLCAWQVIGGVDSPSVRRFMRRHPNAQVISAPRTIPVLVVRMPHA